MQHQEIARALSLHPAWVTPRDAPPVDDVRPARCPACGSPARRAGQVVLEGNGVRQRPVVVARVQGGSVALARDACWSRRYVCNACGRSTLVLPEGVLAGCTYSIPAIVWIWLQSHSLMGGADGDAGVPGKVCAPKGVDLPGPCAAMKRWRSPYRWSRWISHLWPIPVSSDRWPDRVGQVLVRLAVQAASWEPIALLRAEIGRAHV